MSPLLGAVAMVLVHAMACTPFLYELHYAVAAPLHQLQDSIAPLPTSSQWACTAADWLTQAEAVEPLMLVALLAADAALLWFLHRESPGLAWAWFLLVLLLLLLLAGAAWGAAELMQRKLHEALMR
jgi:hypothetical protein